MSDAQLILFTVAFMLGSFFTYALCVYRRDHVRGAFRGVQDGLIIALIDIVIMSVINVLAGNK